MLVSGGPARQPARVRWPLHAALRDLDGDLARLGRRHELSVAMDFRPCPDVGIEVLGADRSLLSAVRNGLLVASGRGPEAEWVLDSHAAATARRRLMGLDPESARWVHRGGTLWAAAVVTWSKNRSNATRSSAAIVASGTLKRAYAPLDVSA